MMYATTDAPAMMSAVTCVAVFSAPPVASFVSMMIVATGGAENTATQVTALIMAGASVVAYIIGEGLTDSANIGSDDSEK